MIAPKRDVEASTTIIDNMLARINVVCLGSIRHEYLEQR